jgi:hypothetical protein
MNPIDTATTTTLSCNLHGRVFPFPDEHETLFSA